jgi:hypothetical protein
VVEKRNLIGVEDGATIHCNWSLIKMSLFTSVLIAGVIIAKITKVVLRSLMVVKIAVKSTAENMNRKKQERNKPGCNGRMKEDKRKKDGSKRKKGDAKRKKDDAKH